MPRSWSTNQDTTSALIGATKAPNHGIGVGPAAADQDELARGVSTRAHLEHAAVRDVVHDDVVLPRRPA